MVRHDAARVGPARGRARRPGRRAPARRAGAAGGRGRAQPPRVPAGRSRRRVLRRRGRLRVERRRRSLPQGLARFPGAVFPLALPTLTPDDVVALAYLRKDLPFGTPFVVHPRPLAFAGGPRRVVAFGLEDGEHGPGAGLLTRQTLLHERPASATGAAAADELALELLPRDEADRIVLGAMPRPATLDEGWRRVAALLELEGRPLSTGTELAIPKVDFAATRRFEELIGARLVDLPPGAEMREASQRIEFTLSEEGARLVASAAMVASCSAPPPRRHLVFDRPFLLALVRRGASRPYFLAWFGNDELFVRAAPVGRGRPAVRPTGRGPAGTA